MLAGDKPWVTVDAAVSNDLFYFNHVPLQLENLAITAPDGSKAAAQNPSTGKYRSVFDVELKQAGTYRIGVVNDYATASWDENGKPKRWRGTPAAFATEVPKDAKDLQVGAVGQPRRDLRHQRLAERHRAQAQRQRAWSWCR